MTKKKSTIFPSSPPSEIPCRNCQGSVGVSMRSARRNVWRQHSEASVECQFGFNQPEGDIPSWELLIWWFLPLFLPRYVRFVQGKQANGGVFKKSWWTYKVKEATFCLFFFGGETLISCWWGSVSGFHDSDWLSANRRLAWSESPSND